jgi:hypothetical protein
VSPLFQLILDPPRSLIEQPRLEATLLGIVAKLGQVPRDGDGRFLNHFVCFRVVQAGLDGKIAHEFAVDAIELLPAFCVIACFEPV